MATPYIFLLLLYFAVASNNCIWYSGPSFYEYDIDKQVIYRDNTKNLVVGWRQYGDKEIYK